MQVIRKTVLGLKELGAHAYMNLKVSFVQRKLRKQETMRHATLMSGSIKRVK